MSSPGIALVTDCLARRATCRQGFRSLDLYPAVMQALQAKPSQYTLASLRYDLWKLRAKGPAHSRRYRLIGKGYAVCLVFLKLFERVYAPLTAGLLRPVPGD